MGGAGPRKGGGYGPGLSLLWPRLSSTDPILRENSRLVSEKQFVIRLKVTVNTKSFDKG